MARKFKTSIERTFFEGVILDIDFSHIGEYIGFIVLSAWGEANGEIFSWRNPSIVRFNCVKDFSIQGRDNSYEDKSDAGINVNGFSLEKVENGFRSATIMADNFEINIVFKSYDENTLSDMAERFAKIAQDGRASFVRPDLEKIASLFFNSLKTSA
ncbi:MAG: hypothetical protein LBQ52_03810 [Helicobacteraceae bacterium]|jgi:hypothetical protein|nr:hypothetical protein [Helicobacteraceae bacterium]